ncbi:MAG: hypothetical protein E7211_00605 [Clostridium lundense]|nr:hypothetical protein [Clostridium lundense]
MKNEIKEKFPLWCQDLSNINNMCLSDDIDSLFSCIILEDLFPHLNINCFYDFKTLYKTDKIEKVKSIFGVDMDLVQGKCWGNHVTLNSPKSANINTILNIGQNNYYKKFAGSTLLTILSYYNVDLSSCTEEQLELLICIDVAFKQYYFNKDTFRHYYNVILEYPIFTEILSEHDSEYFYNIIKEYKLYGHIYVDKDGELNTDINLDKLGELFPSLSFILPQNTFKPYLDFKIVQSPYLEHDTEMVFSCARTYKNALRYSIPV